MIWKITLEAADDGAFAPLPPEMMQKLGVKIGEWLEVTETATGLLLTKTEDGPDTEDRA